MNRNSVAESFVHFDGRWVVVSGASSGLGRAIAVELASHGARLVLIGRDSGRLAETERSLRGEGHRTVILDLTQHELQHLR